MPLILPHPMRPTLTAALSLMSLPVATPDGLDEAPNNGEVSFAGFDLGRDDGWHAGHVGVDTDGIAGAVVFHLHLGASVGAVQGDAEVVARLAVGGPAGLQVQRRPTRETDEGRRQVLDLVRSVALHELEVAPAAPPTRTELGIGGAAHALDFGISHQVEGHVYHMNAEVYEWTSTGELFAGEPTAHAWDAVATHPGSLGVVDPTEVSLHDVPLERLHVAPLTLGEGDVDRASGLPGRAHYPFCLGAVARERLLAEHVPAAFEGCYGDGRVEVVRRPDAYDVEVIAGD